MRWGKIAEKDCPDVGRKYSKAIDELKTMYHIKPKVVQDFTTIRHKFPCTEDVLYQLQRFVSHFSFGQTSEGVH